jgi:hypothetical protein
MALHAISLLTHHRLIDDIERHRDDAHLIVMPPPCPLDIQPIDFAHADELIDVALLDAREFLDSGGEPSAGDRGEAADDRPVGDVGQQGRDRGRAAIVA